MAEFLLKHFSVNVAGALGAGETPGRVTIQSKRLEVKSVVDVKIPPGGGAYYIGYIQVCYENRQANHYGPNVQQRWEFSHNIVSDSANMDERPWYGRFREHNLEGLRRKIVYHSRSWQSIKFDMTDDFSTNISKFETLAGGQVGPAQSLTQIERNQRFRLWLVAVPTSVKADDPAFLKDYLRLAEVDWRSHYDISLQVGAGPNYPAQNIAVATDVFNTKKVYESVGQILDSPDYNGGNVIPPAAVNKPIANLNQQLTRYVTLPASSNIIVARTQA